MSYASSFDCPYCGRPLRARWYRRLGHRFRVPLFGALYIGRIVEVLTGSGGSAPADDEVARSYFFVECKRCKNKVPVPER